MVVDQLRPGFEPDVKVDGKGVIYSSVPFGFSSTQSFIWSSRDGGNSYQLVPGNLAGKPTTCVGGGDTDLFLDSTDALYFSDLQGLTNISNSRSTDGSAHFTTNCLGAPEHARRPDVVCRHRLLRGQEPLRLCAPWIGGLPRPRVSSALDVRSGPF